MLVGDGMHVDEGMWGKVDGKQSLKVTNPEASVGMQCWQLHFLSLGYVASPSCFPLTDGQCS